MVRVMTSDLSSYVRSKDDLYAILTINCQLYCPSYDSANIDFLRDVLSGRKKLLPLSEVKQICVPKFKEFDANKLFALALQDGQARQYLPEPRLGSQKRTVCKKYLFSVSKRYAPPSVRKNF
jgi:RNAse (barnase) inhibitor barstar